jgi:ABC-2 type transport system permease protein
MSGVLTRYAMFTVHGLQVLLSYRSAFILSILTCGVNLLAQLYLWRAIYGGDPGTVLAGFTLAEITTYVLLGNALFLVLDNRADYDIAADIMRGDIIVNFVRPVNYPVLKFFTCLPVMLTNLALVAVPVCLLGGALFGLEAPTPVNALLFAVSVLLSVATSYLINAMVGAVAFVTTTVWGVQMMKTAVISILSGYLIPLDFFGPAWQRIAACLPFQSLVHAPLSLYLGKAGGMAGIASTLGTQLLWVLVLGLLCALLWRQAVDRLEVLGG